MVGTRSAGTDLKAARATIVARFPELAGSTFTPLMAGWDSVAIDVDGRLIFKFPRHAAAERALVAEARLLAAIRPVVTMAVRDLSIHPGPPLFSRHVKLPGEHLLTREYRSLPDAARQRLAADVALFYAELHGLDPRAMSAAGAAPIHEWRMPDEILRRSWPLLPPALRLYAERAVAAWQRLPPDAHGTAFGYFDGHGWNMAFDHATARLNGIYDFADTGFGPLHREFVYPNWIAPDLTARIVAEYEALTGRAIDRERVHLLSGVLRLSELAEHADDAGRAPGMVRTDADWAALRA